MHKRCSDCGKYKRNPGDENLRRLERAALSGDIHAARQLSLEKHRRGLCKEAWIEEWIHGEIDDHILPHLQYCWQCQVKKMQNASDVDARWVATRALGLIGDPAAIPALIETMQKGHGSLNSDSEPFSSGFYPDEIRRHIIDSTVRQQAAEALGRIGDTSVIPALVKTMQNDSDRLVRREARQALEKIDPLGVNNF